ncbi:heavy metal-binding domain-containing protein [Streptomyces sp. NPDC048383]|uniref:heavy metal-binding domain-containing protein n=1 Tax=Streptomyces sp. NPDC048383 TaxID=3155386 RepID=UPI0034478EFB
MDRKLKKEIEEGWKREWAAREDSRSFYSVTVPAPPDPHTALGIVAGYQQPTVMEAVASMQSEARKLDADGVLGVSVIPQVTSHSTYFVAYGTAVQWAQPE